MLQLVKSLELISFQLELVLKFSRSGNMNKLGDKFISGQIINLDCEPMEKLEKLATDLRIKEENLRLDLDAAMNQMINE